MSTLTQFSTKCNNLTILYYDYNALLTQAWIQDSVFQDQELRLTQHCKLTVKLISYNKIQHRLSKQ